MCVCVVYNDAVTAHVIILYIFCIYWCNYFLRLHRLRKELHRCVARCVDNYKNCRLHAERNDAFLELQASLAEDVPGRVGFPGVCVCVQCVFSELWYLYNLVYYICNAGWQAEGKKGYRTAVIALLSTLHDLGNARMVLREVCLTGIQINRDITAQNFEAQEFYFIVKEIQDKLPPTAEPVSDETDMLCTVDVLTFFISMSIFTGRYVLPVVEWSGHDEVYLFQP